MSSSDTISPRLSRESGRNIFGTDAAGYDSARPGYPAELYETIAARAGTPFKAIGEIGPGTGLATAALLEFKPDRYVAFEPDPTLAAYLGGRFATVDVVNDDFCTAEADGDLDLIGAASCFHWLDPDIAFAKARSLLRPGGNACDMVECIPRTRDRRRFRGRHGSAPGGHPAASFRRPGPPLFI